MQNKILTHQLLIFLLFLQDIMQNPFSMFDNMMANVRNRMEDMNRNFVSLLR